MSSQAAEIQWGDEVNGLRLGIWLEKSHYRSGEKPILLEILVANVSPDTVQIIESHILQEYTFEILAGGRAVPMTREGQRVWQAARTLEPSRRIVVDIAPGTIHKVEPSVPLDEWFQLDQPGTYRVQVQRSDWQDAQGLLSSGLAVFVMA